MTRSTRAVLVAVAAASLVALPVAAQDSSPSVEPALAPAASGGAPTSGTTSPRVGDTVAYVSQEGRALGSVSVGSVEAGFDEFSEYFDPDADSQYVAVEFTFSNPGDDDLEVNIYRLSLETPGGFLWGTGYVGLPDDTAIEELESEFELDPGETETGIVFFQVPRDEELVRLWWTPDTGRLLELADLRD